MARLRASERSSFLHWSVEHGGASVGSLGDAEMIRVTEGRVEETSAVRSTVSDQRMF
jgi:hypothetical protein